MWYDDITLEIARLEREALERAERRIRDQQLGEAFEGLVDEGPMRLAA